MDAYAAADEDVVVPVVSDAVTLPKVVKEADPVADPAVVADAGEVSVPEADA